MHAFTPLVFWIFFFFLFLFLFLVFRFPFCFVLFLTSIVIYFLFFPLCWWALRSVSVIVLISQYDSPKMSTFGVHSNNQRIWSMFVRIIGGDNTPITFNHCWNANNNWSEWMKWEYNSYSVCGCLTLYLNASTIRQYEKVRRVRMVNININFKENWLLSCGTRLDLTFDKEFLHDYPWAHHGTVNKEYLFDFVVPKASHKIELDS